MAQLTEILDKEHSRTMTEQKREIYLYSDGSFYRAYEWSAWLIVRYIRQLTVIRRAVKSADAEVVHVGFPKTTLDKYKLDGTEVIKGERCSPALAAVLLSSRGGRRTTPNGFCQLETSATCHYNEKEKCCYACYRYRTNDSAPTSRTAG